VKIVFSYARILVPLDGSEFAERALPPALAIAEVMEAELVLCRVAVPVPRTRELIKAPRLYNELVTAAYREASLYLESLGSKLSYGRLSVVAKSGEGGVARQIVDHAAENDVDLIVMSSHGLSGVSRWVRGSVAEKVLSGATCSTLVVRVQPDLQEGEWRSMRH
jgi:nucleotide-binding universal stress UspA family protein